MAITYEIKSSALDVNEGRAYSNALFADQSITNGLGLGKLVAVKGDGASDAYPYDVATPTIVLADASDKAVAVGFVWRDSLKPVDTTTSQELAGITPVYMPFGDRETEPLVMIKRGVIVARDSDREYCYNTTKSALTGTVAVAGSGTQVDGTGTAFTTELREGDLIEVGGVKVIVDTITSNTELDVVASDAFAGVVASGVAYISSDLFRLIYLGEDGAFTLKTPQSGEFKQPVGYVINGNNVTINLELDVTGSVVA